MDRVAKEVAVIPEVRATFLITGFGFDGGASNVGLGFVSLKSWKERVQVAVGHWARLYLGDYF